MCSVVGSKTKHSRRFVRLAVPCRLCISFVHGLSPISILAAKEVCKKGFHFINIYTQLNPRQKVIYPLRIKKSPFDIKFPCPSQVQSHHIIKQSPNTAVRKKKKTLSSQRYLSSSCSHRDGRKRRRARRCRRSRKPEQQST